MQLERSYLAIADAGRDSDPRIPRLRVGIATAFNAARIRIASFSPSRKLTTEERKMKFG